MVIIKAQGVVVNFRYEGSMTIFGVQNLTLKQYLGSLKNNIDKIQYLGLKNLKKVEESCNLKRFMTEAHAIDINRQKGPRTE